MESILSRFQNIPAVPSRYQRVRQYFQKTQIRLSKQKRPSRVPFLPKKRPTQAMYQASMQENRIDTINLADSMSNYRRWERFAATPGESNLLPGLTFKFISYNILAQDLLVEHLQLYRHCRQEHLKWSHRIARLEQEIINEKPDILCLQEVQESHLNEIESRIKKGMPMSSLFKKKTGYKSDGCAIFYNKSLFEMVEWHTVEYFQPGYVFLDRHNVALIAKLRCKAKPEITFLVCTTHMLFNPRREDIRLAQTILLLAELDRHSVLECSNTEDISRLPIILAGDFNFTPNSATFELIVKGSLRYEDLSRNTLRSQGGDSPRVGKYFLPPKLGITDTCQHLDCVKTNYKDRSTHRLYSSESNKMCNRTPPGLIAPELFSTGTLTHDLNLRSVYSHCEGNCLGSTFQNGWKTVDHIFYSGSSLLRPLSVLQLPTVQDCYKVKFLPNEELGSDHLMLASELRLIDPSAVVEA